MGTGKEPALEKRPIVMCASCWRIQPPQDELVFEFDHWVDPMTFMARSQGGAGGYHITDGYCDPCLAAFMSRIQDVTLKTAHERLNA